jgi:hypothetical protein
MSEGLRGQPGRGGLIFGLIRLRSPTFIDVLISASVQVVNVNGFWRTIIRTPENRKVGGSILSLAITVTGVTLLGFLSLIARCLDMIVGPGRVM